MKPNPESSNCSTIQPYSKGLSPGFSIAALEPQSHHPHCLYAQQTQEKKKLMMAQFVYFFYVAPELLGAEPSASVLRFHMGLLIMAAIRNEEALSVISLKL